MHKQQGIQGKGESHLAEGKSKETSLRIPTASEPVLYTPLTAVRAITGYSPTILALTPLYLDPAYQVACFASEAVLTSELRQMRRRSGVRDQQMNLRNRDRSSDQSSEQNRKQRRQRKWRRGYPLTLGLTLYGFRTVSRIISIQRNGVAERMLAST
jgi:hypothetical protein